MALTALLIRIIKRLFSVSNKPPCTKLQCRPQNPSLIHQKIDLIRKKVHSRAYRSQMSKSIKDMTTMTFFISHHQLK